MNKVLVANKTKFSSERNKAEMKKKQVDRNKNADTFLEFPFHISIDVITKSLRCY